MTDMFLYLLMAILGYIAASKVRNNKEKFHWTGTVQTVAIICLVLLMGMRMGSNDEIIANLGTIGLSALIITLSTQLFSVLAVIAARRIMRIDRYGHVYEKGADRKSEKKEKSEKVKGKLNKMTLIILASVFVGMTVGYVFIRPAFEGRIDEFSSFAGRGIQIGLCILIFFVGTDLGFEGTVFQSMKKAGFRVIVIPFVILIGTLVGGVVSGLPLGLTFRESLAVAGGLGWYSLAPGIIMEAGHITASAVSFLHNVFREVSTILLVPLVADKVGHVETVAMAGSPAMDVCLPIIERATSSHNAVYSFVSGVILSFLVPVIVTIFIG